MLEKDRRIASALRAVCAFALTGALVLSTGCAGVVAASPAETAAQTATSQAPSADLRSLQEHAFAETTRVEDITDQVASLADVGAYAGEPGVYLNNNNPVFSDDGLAQPYGTEAYGELDRLGRCTGAFAVAGPETEPTQKRGSISGIHPSGWQQAAYPDLGLDHLYERSHLIAHCLTAEDANERNLMTGTGYMNQGVMQTLEQKMDRYIDATDGHLLVQVTPVFHGDELVARGVQMQGYSLEDAGASICFNVYLHNVQPGVSIDYATGSSAPEQEAVSLASTDPAPTASADEAAAAVAQQAPAHHQETAHHEEAAAHHEQACSYVLNTNTHKFHYASCSSVHRMKDKNKSYVETTRSEVIAAGYTPCSNCCP